MKVLHLITNLQHNGAETVLYRLVSASKGEIEHVVVSMMGDSYYVDRFRAIGVSVYTLQCPRGRITISGLLTLRRILKRTAPSVVQTWMYHADLIGGIVARCIGVKPVIWGVRCSSIASTRENYSAVICARICALLSFRIPAAIVCCSSRAVHEHKEIGYNPDIFTVIPNGYDLTTFAPNADGRSRLRTAWGVSDKDILLGMVARWHPQKDHENLLKAVAILKAAGVEFRCVLVGTEMVRENAVLVAMIEQMNVWDRVILAGPRDDIPMVMNALDVHLLSSAYGEAFPNVVAEAMASGTPCAVTDVGDAALILGDSTRVAPPKDPEALSMAVLQVLKSLNELGREHVGEQCRARIKENYLQSKMVAAYTDVWKKASLPTRREFSGARN